MNRDGSESQTLVTHSDLDEDLYWDVIESGISAWDTETSGLDWAHDQIATCQVATRSGVNVVVLDGTVPPKRLSDLLERGDVMKVFHHAPFDLRFLMGAWHVRPENVACTKIASKIAFPDLSPAEHSLQPALARHLGVYISKDLQASNWMTSSLSTAQVAYAAADVTHLLDLLDALLNECRERGVIDLLAASWEYLPVRAALDIRGAGDVFDY